MNDTKVDPHSPVCGLCRKFKIPIIGTGIRICADCDGWPPRLEPPRSAK